MIAAFFRRAALAPARQQMLRQAAAGHAAAVTATTLAGVGTGGGGAAWLGVVMLLDGILGGLLLVGWRLTQWPKTRALEALLVTPPAAFRSTLHELAVTVTAFALAYLAAAPVLLVAVALGWLQPAETLLAGTLGLLWGTAVGLAVTSWSYEPARLRKAGERLFLAGLGVYLLFVGLAGERALQWLAAGGADASAVRESVLGFHSGNPFAVALRLGGAEVFGAADGSLLTAVRWNLALPLVLMPALALRIACRLQPHYMEHHFGRRAVAAGSSGPGLRPLAWWAVRRVRRYSGNANVWLALGASALYAARLLAGDAWPTWMGGAVFAVYERLGGVAGLATALTVLAAVPAAYQFGLWDSTAAQRLQKLELLLLTDLGGRDYLRASLAASFDRGRWYALAAAVLILVGTVVGRLTPAHALFGAVGAVAMGTLHLGIGFRTLAKSSGGTWVGFTLSIALPLAQWFLWRAGWTGVASVLPAGAVYAAWTGTGPMLVPLTVFALELALAAWLLRSATDAFDRRLRSWYAANHGLATT